MPIVKEMQVNHAPGPTAGPVVFRSCWDGAVLIAADAASYQVSLGRQPIKEECERAHVTLARLSEFQVQVACSAAGREVTPPRSLAGSQASLTSTEGEDLLRQKSSPVSAEKSQRLLRPVCSDSFRSTVACIERAFARK